MRIQSAFIGFVLIVAASFAWASNFLGLFLTHSPSHVILHMAVVRALVDRGHNVTVITSMPLNDANPGYRHIFLKEIQYTPAEIDALINGMKDLSTPTKIMRSLTVFKSLMEKYSDFVDDPSFVRFIEEDNQFDLLLLGYMYNEFELGIAAHFKCPIALFWMVQPVGHLSRLIGNPTLPAFVPGLFLGPGPMTFSRRVSNFLLDTAERLLSGAVEFYLQRLYKKNFPPNKYPSLEEMRQNISLVLSNHHFSEGPIRPQVPALVEIGGIQIKEKPDPLPNDIEQFLEDSPQGVIFFSLGSYVREDHVGRNVLEIIYNVLSSVPYNVIWKFNPEEKLGNASNILFKKWLPQDDILAHKNLRLFVTHGGRGSITESEYHGVPMVAIPFLNDQPINAKTMEMKGHGVVVQYKTMTEESFRKAVIESMEDDGYRSRVQQYSKLYRDRPLTARENAVFWIEYVIRHRGAPHMQSPLKSMNFLQEYSIDVVLFLIVVVYVTFKIAKIVVRLLVRSLWKACKPKNKFD